MHNMMVKAQIENNYWTIGPRTSKLILSQKTKVGSGIIKSMIMEISTMKMSKIEQGHMMVVRPVIL
jgi:hypothetical protein